MNAYDLTAPKYRPRPHLPIKLPLWGPTLAPVHPTGAPHGRESRPSARSPGLTPPLRLPRRRTRLRRRPPAPPRDRHAAPVPGPRRKAQPQTPAAQIPRLPQAQLDRIDLCHGRELTRLLAKGRRTPRTSFYNLILTYRACGDLRITPLISPVSFASKPLAILFRIGDAMSVGTLEELLIDELKDLYSAEKQIVRSLPK